MARADRTGKRILRSEFNTRVPDLGRYLICTDTKETERNYIEGLHKSLPQNIQKRIAIKFFKSKTEKLIDLCVENASLNPQYCEPWIVFDRDRVPNFNEIVAEAESQNINVGWSNPCIEIWFSAYFGKIEINCQDSVDCCKNFGHVFKRKTGQEYKKSDKKIYELLSKYGSLDEAIERAENKLQYYISNGQNTPSEMQGCTTLHHLVKEIMKKK